MRRLLRCLSGHKRPKPVEPQTTDAAALDQIAAILGLYTTDPGNNPVAEVIADIVAYVQQTGRSTNVPEGA
jgi:hypothetical protein